MYSNCKIRKFRNKTATKQLFSQEEKTDQTTKKTLRAGKVASNPKRTEANISMSTKNSFNDEHKLENNCLRE